MTLRELFNPWGALADAKIELEALRREYQRITDRDALGRFVRR